MTERFRITWNKTYYSVSIPNYEGGEVVRAEAYDALKRSHDELISMLRGISRQTADVAMVHAMAADPENRRLLRVE